MCDHLVIEMKNKGYKPGPASSFFRALCASQVGLGIGPDIRGSLEVDFQPKIPGLHRTKPKKFQPPCAIHCGSKTYPKKINREEKVYANSVVRQYCILT